MIIELAGLPGTGKSTLARALVERVPGARLVPTPYFRDFSRFPFFAWHAVKILPVLGRLAWSGRDRRPTRRALVFMMILDGWPRSLARQARERGGTFILDEGGVCLMARLQSFGSEIFRRPGSVPWWDRTYARWAGILDLVVHAEAPRPLLANRVRSRGRAHEISGMDSRATEAWFEALDAATHRVICRLQTESHSLEVFHADGSSESTPEMLERLTRTMTEHRERMLRRPEPRIRPA